MKMRLLTLLLSISILMLTCNIQLANTEPELVAYIEGRIKGTEEWFHWGVLRTSESVLELELRGTGSQERSTVEIVRYEWDFGDGETAEGEYVNHTYYTGNWNITLTVYDAEGNSASETLKIEVRGLRISGSIQVEFESFGNGIVEWTTEAAHSGGHSLKLLIPDGASTNSWAIVKIPYGNTLNTLKHLSFYVKYIAARPRFMLYLDKNRDGNVDSLLLSDYLDFGDGEWTVGVGGLRWGWTEATYPPSNYGEIWQPFDYWQELYGNATVSYVAVALEYWAVEPEGIGEPLYVDTVTINTITYDLEPFSVAYYISFYTGWNLIGIPMNLIDPSIEGIFAENLTKVKYIFGFDNKNKAFTYWIKGLGGPLRMLEPGKGYWVYVTENFNQTIRYKIEG